MQLRKTGSAAGRLDEGYATAAAITKGRHDIAVIKHDPLHEKGDVSLSTFISTPDIATADDPG